MLFLRFMLKVLVVFAGINAAFGVINFITLFSDTARMQTRAAVSFAIALFLFVAYLLLRHQVRKVEAENARIRAKYVTEEDTPCP